MFLDRAGFRTGLCGLMAERHTTPAPGLTDLLFEEAGVGLCLVAPDGTVLRASAEWLRSTDFTAEQVLGEDIIELFPETRDTARSLHARARAGQRVEVPRHTQRILGRETWWEGSIAPVSMEGGTGLLITSRAARDASAALDGGAALPGDEATLRGMLNATRESIWLFSTDGVTLAANETALARWRRPPGEIIGRPITEYTPGSLGEARLAQIRAVARCGEPLDFEDERNGILFEHNLYPLHGERGRVERVAVFSRDVTQRQRERERTEEALQKSEAKQRSVLENMAEGLVIFDTSGNITYQNPASVRIHDKRLSGERRRFDQLVVNWRVRKYHDGSLVPPEQWAIPRVLRGERVESERFFVDCIEDPARSFVGIYNGGPVHDPGGKLAYGFLTIEDITEQARAEAALRDANEKLREADRRKDEFLGMLSHELRNPLAPIRNSVYILERANPTGEQAARARSVIQRQTEHLTRLVDDLLDVTRIARGRIELRKSRVDLREVVWSAADDFRMMMHDRGIAYHTVLPDAKLWADADATRITQAVGNLLHNAAKFTSRGGEVTLSMRAIEGAAVISVRDTGAGIDPALQPHVFDAFVQGERTLARTEGGLGLGLALVKGITELHGGSVRAQSDGKEKGAEVIVRLPLVGTPVIQEAPRAGVAPSNGGRRVLVVDDNADAAESLADIMKMLGHVVEVAYDGPSAIEKARANPPDVLLCDIGLPGTSGYEVAKALRAAGTNGMLLIAVSGYAQPEDVKKAVEAGFDSHVAKPCDPAQIERLLG